MRAERGCQARLRRNWLRAASAVLWLLPDCQADVAGCGVDWKLDHDLRSAEIEQAEGVVTAAFCGIADSGTIVLHHSGSEGRRVLTLLPDWHLCILCASQIVETLPEYFARCERAPAFHPATKTCRGGPGSRLIFPGRALRRTLK